MAFFLAWAFSVLLNDIPVITGFIKKTVINEGLQKLMVVLTEANLRFFGFETYSTGNFLKITGTPGVIIIYSCLGLRHLTLFTVFIIFQLGHWLNKLWYIIAGNVIIILINVIRITIICLAQHFNQNSGEMVHDVATPFLMYLTILVLWMVWVNKFGAYPDKSSDFLTKFLINIKGIKKINF